ncbi:hypothetical protein [Nitrosopumilus sp.]|nr:hypothetical protein [Nitrosopumilus sp.]
MKVNITIMGTIIVGLAVTGICFVSLIGQQSEAATKQGEQR